MDSAIIPLMDWNALEGDVDIDFEHYVPDALMFEDSTRQWKVEQDLLKDFAYLLNREESLDARRCGLVDVVILPATWIECKFYPAWGGTRGAAGGSISLRQVAALNEIQRRKGNAYILGSEDREHFTLYDWPNLQLVARGGLAIIERLIKDHTKQLRSKLQPFWPDIVKFEWEALKHQYRTGDRLKGRPLWQAVRPDKP